MTKVCERCGRPALVSTEEKCAACGGALVVKHPAGSVESTIDIPKTLLPPTLDLRKNKEAAQHAATALREDEASPPAAAPPPTRSAPAARPAGQHKTVQAAAGEAQAPPTVTRTRRPSFTPARTPSRLSRTRGAVSVPVWKRALSFPFATTTRTVLFVAVPLLIIGFHALNSYMESKKTGNEGSLTTELFSVNPEILPMDSSAAATANAAQSAELVERRRKRGEEALAHVGRALENYAKDRNVLPPGLTDSLGELIPYGLDLSQLRFLEDGKLTAYVLTVSADLNEESVTLKARPKQVDAEVAYTIRYNRKAGTVSVH